MGTGTQAAPGYHVWAVPGQPVAVHLHLDVVDRLLAEIMRGFGAVPKRGAEVGGLLIGTVQPGDPAIVRVEDFESIECDYKRGPSFVLVDADRAAFEDACARWRPDESRSAYAVGYFRSHTRDGLSLAPEDIDLLDRYFPSSWNIALLVRPYVIKVGAGGFFFRENGVFQEATPLEFPFRRRELTGEEGPPRRAMVERRPHGRDRLPTGAAAIAEGGEEAAPSRTRLRGAWIWIPLSFVFLLFGIALGYTLAVVRAPVASSAAVEDFSLGLSVSGKDDNLNVTWDRQAPAIRNAQSGVLEIEDGSYPSKPVPLDLSTLQNGSIIYRNSSDTVRFRLIVYPRARVSVAETLEWKR
jgi:hypothetical protein